MSKKIKIDNLEFQLYIPENKIVDSIKRVAEKLNDHYPQNGIPIVLSVLNGSFLFTADLVKMLKFECEISFVKLSSYRGGLYSSGEVKELIGLSGSVKGRDVIVVEDIVDSGSTLLEIDRILKENGAASVKYCTLLFKPENYSQNLPIHYIGLEIANEFVVGYGLDYNNLGRHYKDIYVVV
ncbi:MAG: hypoxanthine phosphoribosyltransferase [Bacteroidales bacterium]